MSAEKKKIVKRSKTNSVMELVASRLGVTPQELEREVSGKCKNVLNIAGLDKAVDLFWSMIDSPVYVSVITTAMESHPEVLFPSGAIPSGLSRTLLFRAVLQTAMESR